MMRWRRAATAAMIVLVLALTGCQASTGRQTLQASPAATAPLQSTSTTASVGGQSCGLQDASHVGDFVISKASVFYGFNANYMLPDSTPAGKPLVVSVQNNQGYVNGNAIQSLPVVEPASFLVSICNVAASTHRLTSLSVKLVSLTPYSSQLNTLNACGFLYSRTQSFGGECASGYSPDVDQTLQFPANATAPATVTLTLPQPVDLVPNNVIGVNIGVTPPTSAAIMTFQLGLGFDGQEAIFPAALTTQPAINAPIARKWSGTYCNTASMQSQIPATSPTNTYYACPQA